MDEEAIGLSELPKIVKSEDGKLYYVLREVPWWEYPVSYFTGIPSISDWWGGVTKSITDFLERGRIFVIAVVVVIVLAVILFVAVKFLPQMKALKGVAG